MTLSELKDLILEAEDHGYGDADVDVTDQNSQLDLGCCVIGIRYCSENINGKETKYVSIIEQ